MTEDLLRVAPDVLDAKQSGQVIIVLESALISTGLPWPANLETALAAEEAIREEGGLPATVGIWKGKPTIGLTKDQMEQLAQSEEPLKASTRDLGPMIVGKKSAGTTVAATMRLASQIGIRFFATGGIGGVHRGSELTGDVSPDLFELAHTSMAVVCAGAKSILDLPRTLEMLETVGVPVIGYKTKQFPAFYLQDSGLTLSDSANAPDELAWMLHVHWKLGGAGSVIAQPVSADVALAEEEWTEVLEEAEQEAARLGVRGKDVTPALLKSVAERTANRTVLANQSLIIANARLATQIAQCHYDQKHSPSDYAR